MTGKEFGDKGGMIIPPDFEFDTEAMPPAYDAYQVDGFAADGVLAEPLSMAHQKPEIIGDSENDFTRALELIKDKLEIPSDAKALYPGSGAHAGVAYVFGENNTTHVDPDQEACTVLQENGYEAIPATIEEYAARAGTKFDVIVANNTYGHPSEDLVRQLARSGTVFIANNYTRWAHDLAGMSKNVVAMTGAVLTNDAGEPNYVPATELPADATDLEIMYYKIDSGGGVTLGTPEDFNYADEAPKNPDGLFVFKVV